MVVDNLLYRVFKPVVSRREASVVGKGPVKGVVQQEPVRVRSVGNSGGDSLRERLRTTLGVETGLGFRGIPGSGDDTVKPVGNTNIPTPVVSNVDYELFGASCLEVLQTREEVCLEGAERARTEATESQNAGLSVV